MRHLEIYVWCFLACDWPRLILYFTHLTDLAHLARLIQLAPLAHPPTHWTHLAHHGHWIHLALNFGLLSVHLRNLLD